MQLQTHQIHKELLKRCKQNDSEAQYKIYELYHKAVYTSAFRLLHNQMDAEEMMQEAFLTAFSKFHLYQEGTSFGAWIKQIVVRKCIDQLRLKNLKFENFADNSFVEVVDSTEEDWKLFEVERIINAIQAMPTGYRTILSLYLLEGYDHEEIGSILEISSSTSRSQYTRARKKLKQELESVPQ